MAGTSATRYNAIKVNAQKIEDALLNLGSIKQSLPRTQPFVRKGVIYKALADKDLNTLRAISNFWYDTSGIYERICNYFSYLYRYDWYVAPEILDDNVKEEKVLTDFSLTLNWLDNSNIKKLCGDIARTVIVDGAYYGYIIPSTEGIYLQQLPNAYCRSRYSVKGLPCVEFNMKFFDTFKDVQYRMKILNLFPDEFKKGYIKYQQQKIKPDFYGDTGGWWMLEPENCIKFNLNGSDVPTFVNVIPSIIDLDAAQDLDRRKQMQRLLKILVQNLPLDKNGDLIFDVDEAKDIHDNAVEMLAGAVGVDVVTTFADVQAIDLSDKNTTTTTDDLAKVERAVYNASGVSRNLFNTDGNLSLEKSILNDESSIRDLILQMTIFFNRLCQKRSKNKKKYSFKFYMLETTQYNYKEMAKTYKEQAQMGYSKMLPQVALGHSQSFILNTAHFENNVLHLSEIMIPPLLSSTMSGEDLQNLGSSNKNKQTNVQNKTEEKITTTETKEVGRPAKSEDEKSDKTIANQESMN